MGTTNPHDAVNEKIIRRAKKVESEINAAIEVVKRFDLVPRAQPLEFKVFVDERLKPIYIAEEEHTIDYHRRGRWITVREV